MPRGHSTKKNKMPEGKRFTSEYQPTPEAKSAGLARRKARNIVLNTIIKEITENMVNIKIKGKNFSVSTLEAMIKKLLVNANADNKTLMRVINMLLEYESRNTAIEQRQEEFDRKHGDEESEEFNNSFIEALNGKVEEVWKE